MPSYRLAQVQSVIHQYLAQEINQLLPGDDSLVTVRHVDVCPDLRAARVWVTVSPVKNKADIINLLNQHRSQIQSNIGHRHRFKYTPVLRFNFDEGQDLEDRINQLIDRV